MDFKYVGKICPVRTGHVIRRRACSGCKRIVNVSYMGDVRPHNSRTDSRRIFKLGGGVDHVTRHAMYDH